MLNTKTAKECVESINDGFVQPHLLWCANTPAHLQLLGNSLSSNFWIGKPDVVKEAANEIAKFYDNYLSENLIDLCNHHSVSVAYWEIDGIGMVAEIYSLHQLCNVLPEDVLINYEDKLTQILFDGNDNHPGLILENADCNLTVEQRLSLAKLMRKEDMSWMDEDYRIDCLSDFSDEQYQQILNSFVD